MHWEKSRQGRVINRERKTEELAGAQGSKWKWWSKRVCIKHKGTRKGRKQKREKESDILLRHLP